MRLLKKTIVAAAAAMAVAPAWAQPQAFDACQVFTQADAEAALGGPAQPPVENPKARKPKVVPACTYTGTHDGKPVSATAHFRFGHNDEETARAFEDARLKFQTKPLLIRGADGAFWSGRTGEMNVRKGRNWVSLAIGPQKPAERDVEVARKAAESLAKKL
jgi:hypothetical protein